MEPQKASRTEERFATVKITTVMQKGINNIFTQDLPVAIKSPINTPQKTQGTSSAIAKMILMFFSHSSCLENKRGLTPFILFSPNRIFW